MKSSHTAPPQRSLAARIIEHKVGTGHTNAITARLLQCSASYVSKVWKNYKASQAPAPPKHARLQSALPPSTKPPSNKQEKPKSGPALPGFGSAKTPITEPPPQSASPAEPTPIQPSLVKPDAPPPIVERKSGNEPTHGMRASVARKPDIKQSQGPEGPHKAKPSKTFGGQPSRKQEEQKESGMKESLFESIFRTPLKEKPPHRHPSRKPKRRSYSAEVVGQASLTPQARQKVNKTMAALEQYMPVDPVATRGEADEQFGSFSQNSSKSLSRLPGQSQLTRRNGKIVLTESSLGQERGLNGVVQLPVYASLSGTAKEQVEVVQNLRKTEMRRLPKYEKMRRHQQGTMNDWMRALLIDWLVQVHHKFECSNETFYLTVNYIDRVLESSHKIHRSFLEKICVSSLYLACKTDEEAAPDLGDLQQLTDHSVTIQDILNAEAVLAEGLEFSLHPPTPYTFLLHYIAISQQLERVDQKHISDRLRLSEAKHRRFCERYKLPQPPREEEKLSQAVSIFSSQSSAGSDPLLPRFRRKLESRFGIKSIQDVRVWLIASYFLEVAALEPQFYYSMRPSQLAAVALFGARRITIREDARDLMKENSQPQPMGSLHVPALMEHSLLSFEPLSEPSSVASSQGAVPSSQTPNRKRRWPAFLEVLTGYQEQKDVRPYLKKVYASIAKHGDSLTGSFIKYQEMFPTLVHMLPRVDRLAAAPLHIPEVRVEAATVAAAAPAAVQQAPHTPLNAKISMRQEMQSSGATTAGSSATKLRTGGGVGFQTPIPKNVSRDLSEVFRQEAAGPRLFFKQRGAKVLSNTQESSKKSTAATAGTQKTLWDLPRSSFAASRAAMIVSKGIQNAQQRK